MNLLPDAEAYRRLVQGVDRGPVATAARSALALASIPYAAAVAVRQAAYAAGLLPVATAAIPVVSVGNLTLGGTGKTPLVAWVARHYRAMGMEVAIVSRGYGARDGEKSDEAKELAILVPDVAHEADRDRAAAVRRAVARHGAEIVILDDGFQHRRLARSLDIVTIDATDPFGGDRMFPRGLLREPVASIARADAVVVTRCDLVDAGSVASIAETIRSRCGSRVPAVWAESRHGPTRLRFASGGTAPLEHLAGRRVVAVCGIGNPAPFRAMLERLGARLVASLNYPDHHDYDDDDLAAIVDAAKRSDAESVVTTLKDLVKLRRDRIEGLPLAAVEIELAITSGREPLERLLSKVPCAASS